MQARPPQAQDRQLQRQRHGESAEGSSCGLTAKNRRRHPFLTAVGLVYTAAHVRQLHAAAASWVACVQAGHALTVAAQGKLLLTLFELWTVLMVLHLMYGLVRGLTNAQLADRGMVILGIIMPVFQILMAVNSPAFLTVQRTWAALLASIMMLGVVYGLTPTHSLVQLVFSTPVLAFMQCYGKCLHQDCSVTPSGLARCFAVHGWTIMTVGSLAWLATYAVARGQMRRQREARKGRGSVSPPAPQPWLLGEHRVKAAASPAGSITEPSLPRSGQQQQQQGPGSGEAVEAGGLRVIRHTLSSLARRRGPGGSPLRPQNSSLTDEVNARALSTQPSSVGAALSVIPPLSQLLSATSSRHGERGAGAGAAAEAHSSSLPTSQPSQSQSQEPSPMPFSSYGIHVFEALGLGPYLRTWELRVDAVMDCMDDGLVVRIVCLPLAGYSLVLALLVRLRLMEFDFSSLSPDTVIMYMGVWFMLGRDSYTFDMTAAMQQIQEQLSSSLLLLSQPRPQTVTELVDSVRQQIAGGSITPGFEGNIGGDEIQVLEMLGEGTFGKVHKGMWRGTVVAIKSMVLPSNAGLRRERMAIMEAAISAALSHPNVLQTYTYSMQPVRDQAGDESKASAAATGSAKPSMDLDSATASVNNGFEVRLVLEYMDRGTLRDMLDSGVFLNPSGDGVNYVAALETASEVAKGMLHLHSLNILHGDLKARNVLLKSSALDARGFTTKIADFGLSHKMEEMETHVSSMFQGTPSHMAPEVFLEGTQSKGADVYSFGITLWEIYTGRRPFADVAKALLPYQVVERGARPQFPDGTPEGYLQLAQRCWDTDVSKRPSFKEIVSTLAQLLEGAAEVWAAAPIAVTHAFQSAEHGGLTVLGSAVTYEGKPDGEVPTDVREALARWRQAYDVHAREQREAERIHQQEVAAAVQRATASPVPSARLPPAQGSAADSQGRSESSQGLAITALTRAATSAPKAHSDRHVPGVRCLSSTQPQLEIEPSGSHSSSVEQERHAAQQLLLASQDMPSLADTVGELPSALVVGIQNQNWEETSLC